MVIIKRDGRTVPFDKNKIKTAILRAMHQGSGVIKEKIADDIANEIENELADANEINISQIELLVYSKLISKKQKLTAIIASQECFSTSIRLTIIEHIAIPDIQLRFQASLITISALWCLPTVPKLLNRFL